MKRFTRTYAVDLSHVPKAGLYALYRYGKIVYVGQSNNILRRIGEHAGDGQKDFDSFSCIRCDNKNERDELERHWIMKFRPEYNDYMNYSFKRSGTRPNTNT